MLVLYQATAFLSMVAFTNYPLNIMAESGMYGNPTTVSTIYTIGYLIGIVLQLIMTGFIGKIKSIKKLGVILGILTLVFALGIMLIPPTMLVLWLIIFCIECVVSSTYCTFSIGILVGQWFPTRKGTVMGVTTIAFPIGNAVIGLFASSFFGKFVANIATVGPEMSARNAGLVSFIPFYLIVLAGLIIGIIFIKDYPEQCGAYRDNDKNLTPEIANQMMLEEIENKKTTVWHLKNTLKSRDFWFVTIPMGLLLMFAVGMMTQTNAIINAFGLGDSYQLIMMGIAAMGVIGSWALGVLDTKLGTRTAIIISTILMAVSGFVGMIRVPACLIISLALLGLFMGASSNFTVSAAAQYWRREDFPSVFAAVNPIANIFNAAGPMVITMLLGNTVDAESLNTVTMFLVIGIAGIVATALMFLFKPAHVKEVDDIYRKAAGKPLDDVLVGRK